MHMPHRSVTRFFVPLIDVLILLFCIFLLMEFNSESKYDQETIKNESQSELAQVNIEALNDRNRELQITQEELQKLKEANPEVADLLARIEELRKENEKLRSIKLQDRAAFRVIDINGEDGSISFYDENTPDKPYPITDAKSAQALIERHKKEGKSREVYYYFMPPRPPTGYPNVKQNRTYREWFAKASTSLAETR